MRSFDISKLTAVVNKYPDIIGEFNLQDWINNPNNVMYVKEDNVGLFTYEYPGVYSGHWFFEVRGRAALNLAHEMLNKLFEETNAQAIRGLVRTDLLGSKWAARQIGMTSYGIIEIDNKPYELFCMTRKEYING